MPPLEHLLKTPTEPRRGAVVQSYRGGSVIRTRQVSLDLPGESDCREAIVHRGEMQVALTTTDLRLSNLSGATNAGQSKIVRLPYSW